MLSSQSRWNALCLVALAAVLLPARVTARPAPPEAETYRYTVLAFGSRAGTQSLRVEPLTYQGRRAFKVWSATQVKLQAFTEVEQRAVISQVVSAKGAPLRLDMRVTSAGRDTFVRALFYPNRVECTHNAGGQRTRKTIRIPRGVSLIEDPTLAGLGDASGNLRPGQQLEGHYFEPLTLTIQKFRAAVERREALRVGDETVDALVIRMSTPMLGDFQIWADSSGVPLKMEFAVGMAVVRDDLVLPETVYRPPVDFALQTAIAGGRRIPNPRQARSLKVRLLGIPSRDFILADARQQAEVEVQGNELVVTYTLTAQNPPARGARLVTRRAGNPLLAEGTYLNVGEPEIQAAAARIAGRETDRAVVARKIRAWVHGQVNRPANIGVPRSAVEIMKSREGVCRDHALLFTALARAAGIPTRMVAGIVSDGERFFYHAWVECQIGPGDDDWVAYDSTLPTDFVDATHIKLAQGDADVIFRSARLVGQLKAEVLAEK